MPNLISQRRQFDQGMHKLAIVQQSSLSHIFTGNRPCEMPLIPVERCYPHIGELWKFSRERKNTLEDSPPLAENTNVQNSQKLHPSAA
jgi:hypothetical protein